MQLTIKDEYLPWKRPTEPKFCSVLYVRGASSVHVFLLEERLEGTDTDTDTYTNWGKLIIIE